MKENTRTDALAIVEHVPSNGPDPRSELEACETVVREAQHTLFRVAAALKAIHDKKLFTLKGYKCFRQYVEAELGFSRSRAYQLVDSAAVLENLSSVVDTKSLPATEYQARLLAQLSPEAQRAVYAKAQERAPIGQPTSAHIQAAVKEYRGEQEQTLDGVQFSRKHLEPIGEYLWRRFRDFTPAQRQLMMDYLRELVGVWIAAVSQGSQPSNAAAGPAIAPTAEGSN